LPARNQVSIIRQFGD
jgi:hypothetical protein